MSKISDKEIANYAVDQIASGAKPNTVASKIAALLIDERRTRDAPSLIRAIESELNSRGQTQMTVTSANELNVEIKKQLSVILGVKSPVITEIIDPSVIGGVKARAGEKEIDLTVRTRLNKFKQQVTNQGK